MACISCSSCSLRAQTNYSSALYSALKLLILFKRIYSLSDVSI